MHLLRVAYHSHFEKRRHGRNSQNALKAFQSLIPLKDRNDRAPGFGYNCFICVCLISVLKRTDVRHELVCRFGVLFS